MNSRSYNLGKRTRSFAKNVRFLVSKLPNVIGAREDSRQLVRSAGSVAANYVEAEEAESKKDFAHCLKICRKEAKESSLWLDLLEPYCPLAFQKARLQLMNESIELLQIFHASIRTTGYDHKKKKIIQ